MRSIIVVLLIAFLSFAACLFFPWWSIAIVAFVVVLLIPIHPGKAFAAGFFALFLLWGGLSYWISNNNHDVLAHKMSVLVLKQDNPLFLVLATACIGALVAGFGALTGSVIRYRSSNT